MTTTDTPRTDAYQYANYILNHYDQSSHEDKLCLAKSLIEHGYGAAKPKLTRESYDENWNMNQADTPRTDDYYAGKGCECSAHNRSECGCDVDWTDPRIYALEDEVERLKELVNESILEKSNLSIALVNCQANLRRAIDVARMLPVIPIPAISSRDITDTLYAELNQLKATLNPTTEDSSAPQL